jgi:hypothetical protein
MTELFSYEVKAPVVDQSAEYADCTRSLVETLVEAALLLEDCDLCARLSGRGQARPLSLPKEIRGFLDLNRPRRGVRSLIERAVKRGLLTGNEEFLDDALRRVK